MKDKIFRAQQHLAERGLDGWLLYDFHRSNELAHQFLEIPSSKMASRRFLYWIPARGDPVRIVHAIEQQILDSVPGEKRTYSSWQQFERELGAVLDGKKRVAMEYSPRAAIPYVSKVDGGTIDLVRSFGCEVVSSADFLLYFTSVLTREQIESHKRAALACYEIVERAWEKVEKELSAGREITEQEVQRFILNEFAKRNLISDSPPIVAVNAHSADPHYATLAGGRDPIRKGDLVLIDLWAKEAREGAVYGDLTRVAFVGENPPQKIREVFRIVQRAQKAAIDLVQSGKPLQGWMVDAAARSVIQGEGYGNHFVHRTGHNIGVSLHGSGTHMDDLEMHDERPLLKGTCFSIEPGVYLAGQFGIRLETDVVLADRGAEVSSPLEPELRLLQIR